MEPGYEDSEESMRRALAMKLEGQIRQKEQQGMRNLQSVPLGSGFGYIARLEKTELERERREETDNEELCKDCEGIWILFNRLYR